MKAQTIKFKWLISEYDVRSTESTRYPLMSVSQYLGVIPRSELKGDEGRAESTENYKTSKPGQIVLNRMSAASGALGLATEYGLVSPDYAVLQPSEIVDPNYLYHLMKSDWFTGQMIARLKGIGAGGESASVRTPRVNISDLGDIDVNLPKIEEQRKIADYLDAKTRIIDSLVEAKNEQIELYLTVMDSKKNEIIWENNNARLIPLRYLVKCNQNSLGNDTSPEFKFAYCDVGSVNFRTGISTNLESFSYEEAPSRARRLAQEGHIVFSMVRPYLRAVAKVPAMDRQLVFSTAFAVLEPLEISSDYLFEVLTTTRFLAETERWSSGMSYPAINQEELLKIKIPYVDSDSQRVRIAQLSEERIGLIRLIEKIEDSIRALSQYKTAIIEAGVNGELSNILERGMTS